jgi:cell division FtsZ-interacting protein ZapD
LVLYEYPFNEGIRTMLRLEHLFDRLGQLVARDEAVDHHFALATIFEIMDVASRADLKSDLLKEMERHRTGSCRATAATRAWPKRCWTASSPASTTPLPG